MIEEMIYSYSGMNYELMTANCICNSSLLQSISDTNDTINENKDEIVSFKTLTKSIIENLFDFNIEVIKCYNLVFNKKILYNNIGFYFMAFMLMLQIIFLFIFLVKRLKPLKLFMLKFNNQNQKETNSFPPPKNKKKINIKKYSFVVDKNAIKSIFNKNKINTRNEKKNLSIKNIPYQKAKVENNESNSLHKLMAVKKERKIILANNFESTKNIQTTFINENNQNIINKKEIKKGIIMEKESNKNELYTIKSDKKKTYQNVRNRKNNMKKNKDLIKLSKNDNYLQNMDYEQAILYDKRSFIKMYWSFLVDTQIILETFCTENYLNLFIIKLSFLVCTFQISFFLNAFFYTDEYISNAYHNNGVLNFFSGLPKAIYSLLATMLITNILNMLSNSKNKLIFVIRKKRQHKHYLHIINTILKKLRNKLIIYFILVFILDTFFSYYVCAFCSVYRYSQKYWFIGCVESFGMDSLTAIIICILLTIFRNLSIKKRIKFFYILANIISNFL